MNCYELYKKSFKTNINLRHRNAHLNHLNAIWFGGVSPYTRCKRWILAQTWDVARIERRTGRLRQRAIHERLQAGRPTIRETARWVVNCGPKPPVANNPWCNWNIMSCWINWCWLPFKFNEQIWTHCCAFFEVWLRRSRWYCVPYEIYLCGWYAQLYWIIQNNWSYDLCFYWWVFLVEKIKFHSKGYWTLSYRPLTSVVETKTIVHINNIYNVLKIKKFHFPAFFFFEKEFKFPHIFWNAV